MWIKTVNKAIAAEGINLELVAGEGCFYVVGPGCESLANASIYIYRLNDQPLEAWMQDVRNFAQEIKENGYA